MSNSGASSTVGAKGTLMELVGEGDQHNHSQLVLIHLAPELPCLQDCTYSLKVQGLQRYYCD